MKLKRNAEHRNNRQRTRKASTTEAARVQTFTALYYRDYALLWIGMILSGIGTRIQVIAQSLLVLQLTNNSGAALGVVSFTQAAPFLVFSFIGGGLADRVDKRRLLSLTQSLQILFAFALGVLTLTSFVQFWQVLVLSFLAGMTLSFAQPGALCAHPFTCATRRSLECDRS